MTSRPIEWDALHPLSGQPLAIVRLVYLGPSSEPYYRAVSANPERAARKLVGYRGSLANVHTACLALHEQATVASIAGGAAKPHMQVPAQKPPPAVHTPGMASRSGWCRPKSPLPQRRPSRRLPR